MLSKNTIRDVLRVGIGIYICGIVMLAVFSVFGKADKSVILGALLGCSFSVLSFLFLAISLEKSVSSSAGSARAGMGLSYTARLFAAAAMILWAIKAPYFNYAAAIIPLFFQRIVIMILSFTDKRKGGIKNER